MDDRIIELPTEEATLALGRRLAAALRPPDWVFLEGDLGTGKTCLARAIGRALGVPEEIPITSPTFTLVQELEGRYPIVHADLYRIESAEELVELGLSHEVGHDAVFLAEWAARFAGPGFEPDLLIHLAFAEPDARRARLTARTDRGRTLLQLFSQLSQGR